MVDKIKGGLADNMTLEQIAEKHGVTLSAIESALADGIKVEQEHTDDVAVATEIAKDHLFEMPDYYSKLDKMEKQNEAGHWITVKPHEDSKGSHLFIKEGQDAKEAIDEKFGKNESKKEKSSDKINPIIESKSKKIQNILAYIKSQINVDLTKYIGYAEEKGYSDKNKIYIDFDKIPKDLNVNYKLNKLKHFDLTYNGGMGTFLSIKKDEPLEKDYLKDNKEKQNSKDWAKTYKASNFIEKGVCTYNDETIYLSQEALNKAIASIKGRPVVIKHQKVTPQNMEDHAVGYVSGCGFSEWDASFYCDFLVFDDEGKEVIAKDYSVSCAYIPKAFGKGGTWHNTPYDREVTELEFTHLALVPDPRYEDAKIYENSKDDDNTTKENYNMENEKVEVPVALLDKIFGFIQQPFLNAKEEPKEKEDVKVDDDEMEYEGKKYSKKELVNAYESACAGKKAEEEKEKQNSQEQEEVVEQSTNDDMEFFNSMQKLMATANTDANDKVEVHSQNKGLELGSKAFG